MVEPHQVGAALVTGTTAMQTSGLLLNPRLPLETAKMFQSVWDRFAKEEPSLFTPSSVGISTSGSTGGMGSIIVLSREALETSARAVNRRLGATAQDVWGLTLPLFHVGGYSIPLRAGFSQSRVAEYKQAWGAEAFHRWLEKEDVTLLSLVPTQVFDLVQAGLRSPSRLRAIVVGGGRLDEALHLKAKALGWPVLQSYGLTECCSQVATAKVGSDGQLLDVLDHVEVRTDERKKLWIRSKSLLSARIVFDQDLVPRLEKPVDADGWFETADRAEIQKVALSDGMSHILKVLGREGESVKVLGELVDLVKVRAAIETVAADPTNSDGALLSHRTWVVAVPEARREHELVFVVEHRSNSKDAAEQAARKMLGELKSRLAPFEVPSRIVVLDEIPRSSLGKVLTSVLTERVAKP